MGRRSSTSRLIGREAELADLRRAVTADDPERPVIVVSGEAGIGKTRLLSEVVADAGTSGPATDTEEATGPSFVRGSCLRLADGELPFAPILEILDGLRGRLPAETFERVRSRLQGAGPDESRSPSARALRFSELHDALTTAAGPQRLTIVIDDLHWADQSTLDLVLFLARRLRGEPVVLLLAYRSDELHRRHPLRPVIAELSRGYVRERVELGPLDASSVAAQVAELGGDPRADQIAAIVERSDGNPFYVEELVALDPAASELPASVRDVLLARLSALEPPTVETLAVLAVIGREADAQLLTEVMRMDASDVERALYDGIEHGVIVAGKSVGTYRFRHALLEEASHDDLLPGRRVDLHRRVAAALLARAAITGADPQPGELARHLDLSGQQAAALDAFLDAANLAFRAFAWAEGIAAFDRAAEILASEPTSEALERRLVELVEPAAQALNWTGSAGRAVALLREWIGRSETSNVEANVRLWMALGRILNDMGDEPASQEALQKAASLYAVDNTTPLGIDILLGQASDAWVPGRTREALALAEQALDGAERQSDPALLFRALVHRAEAAVALGHLDVGMADVARAQALQAEHGFLDFYGHLATNVGSALADHGELALAGELLAEGLQMSRDLGIVSSWDPWNLPGRAYVAFLGGRWAEADGFVAGARSFGTPGMPTAYNEFTAGMLAVGRGDLAAADHALDQIKANTNRLTGDWHAAAEMLRAARADAAGDHAAQLAHAESAMSALEGLDSFAIRTRAAADIATAAADLAGSLHPIRDRDRIAGLRARASTAAEMTTALDAGEAMPGTRSTRWTRAMAQLAATEAARAHGEDDPGAWETVGAAFQALEMAPRVAYAHYRAAGAALRSGRRETPSSRCRRPTGSRRRSE